MKNATKAVLAIAALGVSAWMILAQDSGAGTGSAGNPQRPPRGQGAGRPHRPPPPIIAALDANHDGVIDAAEIANAPAALRTLDKNGDGQLTMDELMPPPPPRGENDHQGPPPHDDGNPPPPPQDGK